MLTLNSSRQQVQCEQVRWRLQRLHAPQLSTHVRSYVQGRRFWLAYVLYYNESYGTMEYALSMAKSLMPTEIVMNVGVWLHWSKPGCETPGSNGTDHDGGACPPMPYMCEEFKKAQAANSTFRLWWSTPVPNFKNGTLTEVLEEGHHLNVRERCSLDDSQVRCDAFHCAITSCAASNQSGSCCSPTVE